MMLVACLLAGPVLLLWALCLASAQVERQAERLRLAEAVQRETARTCPCWRHGTAWCNRDTQH